MPLYFAYGSNMDREAMRARCPKARPLGRARLMRHRFFIMGSGFASVKRDAHGAVHGVLYDLPFADMNALDRYEDVGRGLYQKITQPVVRDGAAPMRALIYVGASAQEGVAAAAYLDAIIAAAKSWELPERYVASLASLGGSVPASPGPGERRAIRLKGI
jgi:gamma-glutamylcyclotransferase (GGCT)/AIG2-like uncharacterized protein YtfP